MLFHVFQSRTMNYPKFDSSTTPMAITAPIPAALSSMVSSMYHAKNGSTGASSITAQQTNASAYNNSNNGGNQKLHINSIKQFATKMSYKNHDVYSQQPAVKTKNAKKYKCDLCGRGFSRSNTLITHRVSL